jgi:hypothetical protein
MASAIQNPLYGIQVGSIFTESGKHGATVLKLGLTDFDHQQSAIASMSGTSQYIYTDQMNQGSFTAAGSYGVSGLSKISGAVSGYVGNAVAKSSESLSINMNLIKWAGIEYIKFNTIKAADLLAGLQENAQAAAMHSLEAFVKLQEAKPDSEKAKKWMAEWIRASAEFYQSFGAGLVVGVLWGGWGTVKLDFAKDGSSSKWEGGGSANFSYAGPAAAVDVAATYGHTEETIGKSATAKMSYLVNGACVEADIKRWYDDLQATAEGGLTKLGKEPVSHAGAMAGPLKPPAIPKFNKPEPEKNITDLMGSINSLDGLQAYAKAAAFEKQKKAGGTDDLDAFLKSADKANDVSAIPRGAVSPDDEVIILGEDRRIDDEQINGDQFAATASVAHEMEGDKGDGGEKNPDSPDMSDYEPMGIWTMPWGQLFPWLVTGQDNRVPQNAPFRVMIQLKTLHQDFLSLARLYDRLAAAGAHLTVKGEPVDFKGIRDAFSHGASDVDEFLMQVSERPVDPAALKTKITAVMNGLRRDAKTIYKTWISTDQLRSCELGAAVLFLKVGDSTYKTVSEIQTQNNHIVAVPTAFVPEKGNYEQFSQAVKGWPFVLPGGQVGMFMCDGKQATSGFLTAWLTDPVGANTAMTSRADYRDDERAEFTPEDRTLIIFNNNYSESGPKQGVFHKYVSSGEDPNEFTLIQFHPIPFSAAKGINDWKGAALTAGMGELPGVLQDLRDELAKMKSWSFDSDWWSGKDWKDFRYTMQMRPSYIGLVDEPTTVFGSRG